MIEAPGAEYPKAIYRDGGAVMLWGEPIETSSVGSAEEEEEALASGWRLHPIPQERDPLDHDGDGHKGGSVDGLDQKDVEELRLIAQEMRLQLHHKTGRDKLLAAIRGNG